MHRFGAAAWLKPSQRRKNFWSIDDRMACRIPGIKDVRLHLGAQEIRCQTSGTTASLSKVMQPYQLADWRASALVRLFPLTSLWRGT